MAWRVVSVVGAVLGLAVASAVVISEGQAARRLAAARAQAQADAKVDAVVAELRSLEQDAVTRAATGASLAPVEQLVRAGANAATWRDFMGVEAAWEPFRAAGPSAVVVGDAILAALGDDIPASLVVRLARDAAAAGSAAQWDGTRLWAAARVPGQGPTGLSAAVVVGDSLTLPRVQAIADRQRAGVEIRTRVGALTAGPPELVQALSTRSSRPATSCCAERELGRAVTVAAAIDDTAVWATAERESTRMAVVAFGLAGLLAMGLLLFGFLPRGPSVEQERRLRATELELARSRSELKRLTQLFETGGGQTGAGHAAEGGTEPRGGTQKLPLPPRPASLAGNRYEVLSRLGSGGMGDVFLTVLRGPEGFTRHLVLKRLRAELQASPEAVAQFVQEAQLGASLSHPNIVPVFDFGRDAEGYFLTQEYIPGRSVEAFIHESMRRDGRPLPVELALGIAHQVLTALAYAHAKTSSAGTPLGIVHRDVSPTNVMVADNGVVKLLDFGIVKSGQPVVTTRAGVVKGNPYFMPPEQARGLAVDHRADLFSLGMLLFHAVSGSPLYDGGEPYAVLNRCAMGPTQEDLARVQRLGPPVADVIAKAIGTHLNDRFQSARAFMVAVEATGRVASPAELERALRTSFAAELAVEKARYGLDL